MFCPNVNKIMEERIYMNEIIKRLDIQEIFNVKSNLVKKITNFEELDCSVDAEFKIIHGYKPYRIDYRFENNFKNPAIKYIDRTCWSYLVDLYELQKYMLCTDYEKMQKEINEFVTPDFTIENAQGWIDSLKDLIFENVKTLIKQVFKSITEKTYYTGSGYPRQKKKRNNNGIDESFIIYTNDYSNILGYCSHNPTITDDLEKVCYILSGEKLPDVTCKDIMRQEKKSEFENDYFYLKVCKNGNTHYRLNEDIRNKLNIYGAENGIIGENIKIKIFSKDTF
jgi:hypothetical protein